MTKNSLLSLIKNKELSVSVIGLGYVGLPLALAIANSGMKVFGIDIAEEKIQQLNEGISYIEDVSSKEVRTLIQEKQFIASTNFSPVSESHIVIICVPTPLGTDREIDPTRVYQALASISPYFHKGILISLESTMYPGFTREEMLPYLENLGFTIGEDFFLCFSPERVNPGSLHYNIQNTPKIVGAITPACLSIATTFYQTFIEQVCPVSNSDTAEMVKLLENTFRYVNIGFVNEMMMICEMLDLNIWEILEAADTKPFGFMKFLPGPGVGGHCIPIDPHYLNWKLKKLDIESKYIQLAEETNQQTIHFWVKKLISNLIEMGCYLPSSQIVIFGVAYKKDIADLRESPALHFIDLIAQYGIKIHYYDPYISMFTHNQTTYHCIENVEETLSKVDHAIILTDHTQFNNINFESYPCPLLNTRGKAVDLSKLNSQHQHSCVEA